MRPRLRVLIGSSLLIAFASFAIGQTPVWVEKTPAPPPSPTAPILYRLRDSQFSNAAISVIETRVHNAGPSNQSPWKLEFQATTPAPPPSMSHEMSIAAKAIAAYQRADIAQDKYGSRPWKVDGRQIESHSPAAARFDPQDHMTFQTFQPNSRSDYRGGTPIAPSMEVIRSNDIHFGSDEQKRRLIHLLSETEKDFTRHLDQKRTASGTADSNSPLPPAINDDVDPEAIINRRPVVYHAGNLPPGIPEWFAQLDTDHDGQVGLYEWKVSARPITEFYGMDRNGDGLLTIRELMHYLDSQSGNSKFARSTQP